MHPRIFLIFCIFAIICLAIEARFPGVRSTRMRSNEGRCTVELKADYVHQFESVVHVPRMQRGGFFSHRVCPKDRAQCISRRKHMTISSQVKRKKGETTILSNITMHTPHDRSQFDFSDWNVQWRMESDVGFTTWTACHMVQTHQRFRRDSFISEVTMGPPDFGIEIDSIDLDIYKTKPPPRPTKKPIINHGKRHRVCEVVGRWAGVPGMASQMKGWCLVNCNRPRGSCPRDQCRCKYVYEVIPTRRPPRPPKPAGCRAVGAWRRMKGMDQWCVVHCRAGGCSRTHCSCGKN